MILVLIGTILRWAAQIYILILLARVVFDWARVLAPRWVPSNVVLIIADWVYRLTDPPLRFMSKFIPPLRLGNIALDVGFIVVFLAMTLIRRFGDMLVYLGHM